MRNRLEGATLASRAAQAAPACVGSEMIVHANADRLEFLEAIRQVLFFEILDEIHIERSILTDQFCRTAPA
jgi:hypothetical protein